MSAWASRLPRRFTFVASLLLAMLLRLSGADAAGGSADPRDYLAEFGRLARIDWPKNRTLTVVCFGHSVPAGYARTPEVRSLDAYPNLLRIGLAAKYPHAVINVIVSAVGGEDAETGARRYARDVAPLRPDVVLLDYGLNDRRAGLARARQAWSAIIAAAQADGARVLLLTPTADAREHIADPNSPLHAHAAQIRELAREYGVGLVDSYAAFADYVHAGGRIGDLLAQTNHPNRRGHELVAERILAWFP